MNQNYHMSNYYQNLESSKTKGESEKSWNDTLSQPNQGLNIYSQQTININTIHQMPNNYQNPLYHQRSFSFNHPSTQEFTKPTEFAEKYPPNAYLGGNLWDHRNDFFLSEKQFDLEYQNKSDTEFLEHLQNIKKDERVQHVSKFNQDSVENENTENNSGSMKRDQNAQHWSNKDKSIIKANSGISKQIESIKNYENVPSDSAKDEKYWSRRKKNNVAAKKSRDARRIKENQLVMAAQFLETENSDLKMKVEELKKQTEMLLEKLKKYE